jgi:hypothetical protein
MLGLLEQSVVLCKQGVAGSIPVTSTNHLAAFESLGECDSAAMPPRGLLYSLFVFRLATVAVLKCWIEPSLCPPARLLSCCPR